MPGREEGQQAEAHTSGSDAGGVALTADMYLQILRLSADGDVNGVDEDQWDALEALRKTLGRPLPQEVVRLANRRGVSAWVNFKINLILNERDTILFVCDCAERVLHVFEREYPEDRAPREAIHAARLVAYGQGTIQAADKERKRAIGSVRQTQSDEILLRAKQNEAEACSWNIRSDITEDRDMRRAAEDAAFAAVQAAARAIHEGHPFLFVGEALSAARRAAKFSDRIILPEERWQIGRLCAYVRGEALQEPQGFPGSPQDIEATRPGGEP